MAETEKTEIAAQVGQPIFSIPRKLAPRPINECFNLVEIAKFAGQSNEAVQNPRRDYPMTSASMRTSK